MSATELFSLSLRPISRAMQIWLIKYRLNICKFNIEYGEKQSANGRGIVSEAQHDEIFLRAELRDLENK